MIYFLYLQTVKKSSILNDWRYSDLLLNTIKEYQIEFGEKSIEIDSVLSLIPSFKTLKEVREFLKEYKIDINHSEKLESLLVQHDGRIKPFSTLTSEFVRKISRKETLYDLNPTQIITGVLSFPELWRKIPLIKVQNKELK